eukprot:Seg2299.6 transcript_id=Seg2299.6/GoldUCD/mRNA.D3Y31 product="Ganglioside GM2 activator" protein_id=Seg2299.6/GoldUCD/D3Y31
MLTLFCLMAVVAYGSATSFSNCAPSAPVSVILKSIPSQIRIAQGTKIPVSVRAVVSKKLPSNFKAVVTAEKKILWGYVTLPCMSNVGSCTYNFGCAKVNEVCPHCQCPLSAGTFDASQTIVVPSINIPSFLSNGNYKITVRVYNPANNELLGCGKISTKVVS